MTVREVLEKMTSRELCEWRAYFRILNFEHEQRMAESKGSRGPSFRGQRLPTE
jgi:hypothetical protein